MKPKHQRLVLLALAVLTVGGAAAFGLSAMSDRMLYFYAPSDVVQKGVQPGQSIRLGGLVQAQSVEKLPDGNSIRFTVTDMANTVDVVYTGIVPDLFSEGQGVVAEGSFAPDMLFRADSLLAKHDENYMPPEVAEALKRSGEWKPGAPQPPKSFRPAEERFPTGATLSDR